MTNNELGLDHPPRGIRMEQTVDGGTAITVRIFGVKSFRILIGALFLNGIISLLFYRAILEKNERPWFSWLIFVPFIAYGIYSIWSAIYSLFGKCVIRISGGDGSVFTGVGFLGKTRHFFPQSIKSIFKDDDNLMIEMKTGRDIMILFYSKIRGAWLASTLRKLFKCPPE